MAFSLRKRLPISYYEPEEPAFDQYLYCDECFDFVYEYCSIHGPLLVVPDNEVATESCFPSYVPRAALTIPSVFLHLAPSIIPGAGLGVFATLTLPRGVRFGPYRGQRTQEVDSMYCWQIYDSNRKRSHVVDAGNANRSNWMRYVNCARHWREQNVIAYQYQGQLYYRTIKIIPRFTELMIFYGGEFAHKLHIDLAKYNKYEQYQEIIGTTLVPENQHQNIISEETSEDVSRDDNTESQEMHNESYLVSETCQFIDEETDIGSVDMFVKSSNLSNTEENQNNKIKSTKHVAYDESGRLLITINNDFISLHMCNVCQKSFSSRDCLRRHSIKHNGQKRYECTICTHKTNLKYMLNRHILTHTKTLERKQNPSRQNKKILDKEKQCPFCDFKTISRNKFSYHLVKHKGNLYKCDLCDYSTPFRYTLVKHLKGYHKF